MDTVVTLTDALFNGGIDSTSISSNKGGSCGGSLNPLKRIGDLENKISIGTAGAYLARSLVRESVPYYREYNDNGLVIYITYHFLTELRRQLSGTISEGSSNLSHEEEAFYSEYRDWSEGADKVGELLLAVQTLDEWIIDELTGIAHPELNRDYTVNHKWRKTESREVV